MSKLEICLDEMGELLDDVEELFEARFKIGAAIPMCDGKFFRFGKVDGQYGLWLHNAGVIEGGNGMQAIADVSIRLRIEAILLLPVLWKACLDLEDERLTEAILACNALRSFIELHSAVTTAPPSI